MMLCKYCEIFPPENIPYRTNSNEWHFIDLIASKEDGDKELIVSCKSEVFGLQINYCPMCGRRLNKEIK